MTDREPLELRQEIEAAKAELAALMRDSAARPQGVLSRLLVSRRIRMAPLMRGLLLLLALLGLGCEPSQPNILLIIGDDLSWDHYGFSGHPIVQTPALDSLAAESIRYTHAYTDPFCRPSLATLLTGLPQQEHGITYTIGPQLKDFDTIAHRLGAAGYSTYQAGKFWEGLPTAGRGFDANSRFTSYVGDLEIGRVGVDAIFDWVATANSPWFIWFSPMMPHVPHDPPDRYVEIYEDLGLPDAVVLYYAMISWFDDVVAEVIAGLPTDTVVIYLADNGYLQSEIPEIPAQRSKASSYEHGIRTELLIRHPLRHASLRWDPVHLVDVSTTILALAGADTSGLPGRDLLGLYRHHESVTGATGLPLGPPGEFIDRWVVHPDRWKLVDDEAGASRLHHLGFDPEELLNLAENPLFARIRRNLQRLIDAAFDDS